MQNLMIDEQYKDYLDRWQDQDWKEAGDRTAKTMIKMFKKWFGYEPYSILDVGCMNGYVLDAFIRLGFDSWGLEPTNMYMHSKNRERVFNIPLHELKRINFDFIFCSEVLEHIPENQIMPSLIAIRDSLNGAAFITISEDKDVDPTHVTIRPRVWWLDRMKEVGLTYHPDKKTMKGFNFYCVT